MAGVDRMTVAEVVREVLRDEHADVIRESVRAVAQELMEAEISELIDGDIDVDRRLERPRLRRLARRDPDRLVLRHWVLLRSTASPTGKPTCPAGHPVNHALSSSTAVHERRRFPRSYGTT